MGDDYFNNNINNMIQQLFRWGTTHPSGEDNVERREARAMGYRTPRSGYGLLAMGYGR